MKKIFFAILMMAIMFSFKVNAQVKVEGVTSVYHDDLGKYTYNAPLPEVPIWKNPIVSGDWIGWDKQPVTSENGYYHFELTSFNGPIIFYWNDFKDKENPYLNESFPGYDPVTKCIKWYLQDGNIYDAPVTQKQPGPMGDNIIRWEDHGKTMIVSFNNNPEPSGSGRFFAWHSANDWKEIPQKISDASGWGSIVVDKEKNKYPTKGLLGISYGGYLDTTKVWPTTVQQSSYWNDEKKCFEIPIERPLDPDEKKYY